MRTGVAAQKKTHSASRYLRAARLCTSAPRSAVMRWENSDSHALNFIARIPYSASLITYNTYSTKINIKHGQRATCKRSKNFVRKTSMKNLQKITRTACRYSIKNIIAIMHCKIIASRCITVKICTSTCSHINNWFSTCVVMLNIITILIKIKNAHP